MRAVRISLVVSLVLACAAGISRKTLDGLLAREEIRDALAKPATAPPAVGYAEEDDDLESLEDFAGLSKRRPLVAMCMGIFLVSLAGVPPFGGFMAKFFVFKSAIDTGSTDLVWLAILGVITSMASLYYYLRVLVYMYFREPATSRESLEPAWGTHFALFVCSVAVLVFGIFPSRFLAIASESARALGF